MGKHQRRHSSLDELPEEVKREVHSLLIEPNVTYIDVEVFLKGKGHDISHSAIGRYAKWFNEWREIEMLRDQAAMIASDPTKALELEKLTSTMITKRLAMAMQRDDFEVLDQPKLIDAYAKLQTSSIKREQWNNEIKKKADKAADKIDKKFAKQFAPDTLKYIKEVIYGLAS